jgi:predicted nucleotidyltransferase
MEKDDFKGQLEVLGWSIEDFPNLDIAFTRSLESVVRARADLAAKLGEDKPGIDVVAFGSLARHEMTAESDLDYLVVVYSFDEQPGTSRRALTIANSLRDSLSSTEEPIRGPGATGLFGKMISAVDLVEVIGLEGDTNHSHSRRILFLEESVSLYDPARHRHLLESIVRRYLDVKPIGPKLVPRFLLNDLARYWRTLAIDYQAKTPGLSSYSLRYLKLVISRKFTYAASVLPLLVVAIADSAAEAAVRQDATSYFVDSFSVTPVIRYLKACEALVASGIEEEVVQALHRVLSIIDEMNGLLGDKDWRQSIVLESALPNPKVQPHFETALALANELQEKLEMVFFSQALIHLTRRYLVF